MPLQNNINVTYLCRQPSRNLQERNGETYCRACKKNIPDLRDTDLQTIRQLLHRDGGEICGIFYEDQFSINAGTKKSPTFLKLVVASALTVLTTGKLSAQAHPPDSV